MKKELTPEQLEQKELGEVEATSLPKAPKEKAAPAAPRKKANSYSTDEVTTLLDTLIGGASKAFGYQYHYVQSDFQTEAAGIVRLSEKFPVVGKVLLLTDPLLIIFGLLRKFRDISATKPKPAKPALSIVPQPAENGFNQPELQRQ